MYCYPAFGVVVCLHEFHDIVVSEFRGLVGAARSFILRYVADAQ